MPTSTNIVKRTTLSRGGARVQGPALYHQLVIHNGTVYLAGQTAASLAHDKSGDTYAGQAAQQAGSSRRHMLHVLVHLRSITDGLQAFNAAWREWLDNDEAFLPARTTVEAPMVNPEFLVELTVTAAVAS